MSTTPTTPESPASPDSPGNTSRHAARGRVLVTGASGYVGGLLVATLLDEGWTVRVLTRHRDSVADRAWADRVEVAEGSADNAGDLRNALADVNVAYYLIHSMDGQGDFAARDRQMAEVFGRTARECGVGRIVYLGGMHPDGELSPHLASRVEVGDILMASGVPTAVLQAAVVLGDGSASFDMLRYLTSRLPAMVAPKWLHNRIQPIAVDDVMHYLAAAASLPDDLNRTFDIGGPDVLTYGEMMQGFARVMGLRKRVILTVPVLTPKLASHWIGLVTPVDTGVAKPLVDSLVHEVVCQEQDLQGLVGAPPGGATSYRDAVEQAMAEAGPDPWLRNVTLGAAGVGSVAVLALARRMVARRGR